MAIIYPTGISPIDCESPVSIFDEILCGGLKLPAPAVRGAAGNPDEVTVPSEGAVIMLITGPPGVGKTVLALELCNRLAAHSARTCVYFSTESTTQALTNYGSPAEFNWADEFGAHAVPFSDMRGGAAAPGGLVLVGVDDLLPDEANDPKEIGAALTESIAARLETCIQAAFPPSVVVIDNLNIVEQPLAQQWFMRLRKSLLACDDVQLAVFVFEGARGPTYRFWQYIADMVISLEQYEQEEYALHSLEITKSRRQAVRLGRHRMRIMGMEKRPDGHGGSTCVRPIEKTHVSVPAGIRLYMSPHLHLALGCDGELASVTSGNDDKEPDDKLRHPKRRSAANGAVAHRPRTGDTELLPGANYDEFNSALGGGVPRGKATAWLGEAGTFKTAIGYDFLIHGALTEAERCVLISLRSDESAIEKRFLDTLTAIQVAEPAATLQALLDDGLLRHYHFRPGYISPDEFLYVFTRLIERGGCADRLVLDDIAQLRPSFPLCRRMKGFLSAIRDVLYARGVTAFINGVTGHGEDADLNFDLAAMSEVVVRLFHMLDMSGVQPAPRVILSVDRAAPGTFMGQPHTVSVAPLRERSLVRIEKFAAGWGGLARMPYARSE